MKLALAALGLMASVAVEYTGPDRTVSVWEWERLVCHYQAVYDPPGPGWYGCTLELYQPPDESCPSDVAGYFTPSACGWPSAFCQSPGCDISLDRSIESCNQGQPGCRAVEHQTTYPEATVSGSIGCTVPGAAGWCRGGASLTLSGSEPLAGHTIVALEGTRNGEPFACDGAGCPVPLVEGPNDFTFWAVSSWGDTSRMGSASGLLDSGAPSLSASLSGTPGESGWYISDVTLSADATDAVSGLASLLVAVHGGAWAAYTGPLMLSDGEHAVGLRAVDVAGNGTEESLTVRTDTQPPVLGLQASGSFCPGCGGTLAITIEVQDAGSGIATWALTASGSAIASGDSPSSQTLNWDGAGIGSGQHTLELEARDVAGNESRTTIDVQIVAPTPTATFTPGPTAANTSTSTPMADKDESAPGSNADRAGPPLVSPSAPTATRAITPTRTPSSVIFGGGSSGMPGASLPEPEHDAGATSPQQSAAAAASSRSTEPDPSTANTSSRAVFGAAALALGAAATVYALEQRRRRREREARMRAQMEQANRQAEARERAERSRLAALAAAAAAAAGTAFAMKQAKQRRLARALELQAKAREGSWWARAARIGAALDAWRRSIRRPIVRRRPGATKTLAKPCTGGIVTGVIMFFALTPVDWLLFEAIVGLAGTGPVGLALDVFVLFPIELVVINLHVAFASLAYHSSERSCKDLEPSKYLLPPWGFDP